ncbi:MAG: EAL domain-containing protein [Mobilicoccus sp.]|nr:EAL domain-containing protein [Mobilicoccus sp.]
MTGEPARTIDLGQPSPLIARYAASWRWIVVGLWVAALAVAAISVTASEETALLVDAVFTGGCLLAAGAGPLLMRATPINIWHVASIGMFTMAISVIGPWVAWSAGPFEFTDMFVLLGYMSYNAFLIMLVRHSMSHMWVSILDTGAATNGAVLALWVLVVAPRAHSADTGALVIWSLYPILGLGTVGIIALLARRLGRIPAALAWLLVAALFWMGRDISLFIVGDTTSGAVMLVIEVLEIAPAVAMALGLCHPRLQEMTPKPRVARRNRWWDQAVAVVAILTPVVIATFVPNYSDADRFLRSGNVAILLGMLFGRLAYTMWALRSAEQETRERAVRDPLTGLLNRGALFAALEQRLARDRRSGQHTLVLFLDCDDFKRVNDTWGHRAGDTLLIDLARRLPRALRDEDLIARHGGDEFVVVSSVSDGASARAVAARVHAAFSEPLRILPDRTHQLSPSIGAAFAAPDEDCSGDALIGRADAAMYAAKRQGKGRVAFFDTVLAQEGRRRQEIGDRLGLLEADAVDIVLHPIMGGAGYTRLLGWEALARWNDPQLGEVSPEEFVPVAEGLGLAGAMGEIVLRRACAEVASARAAGAEAAFVAVDVSPTHLVEPGFADLVRGVLADAGVPPCALRLEITESVLASNTAPLAVVEELRALGVRFCVDDFGSGYASLAALLRWPVDCVKLDPSLVRDIADHDPARRRLAAILTLVRSLDITDIVAEGVDTQAQVRVLADLECPALQGGLYAPPASTWLDACDQPESDDVRA